MKENALKDLLITTPDMMAKAFGEKTLVKSFVSAGMLDKKLNLCPDLFGLLSTFKIDWDLIPGGQPWFLEKLPYVIAEMYANGEVSESFYNEKRISYRF